MVDFSTIGTEETKKGPLGRILSAPVRDAKQIFNKLLLKTDGTTSDALTIAAEVAEVIISSKGSDIDILWEKLSKKINGKESLVVQADTGPGQLNTALGLIYAAMEKVDRGDSIAEVRGIRNIYNEVRNIVGSRFQMDEAKPRRELTNTLRLMESFFDRVAKRFNGRVKAQEIHGPEIEGFFGQS